MRASTLCCLLSCLASSALAVHHPLHRHRHDKEKRTEVLVVEDETTVEDIDVTIYLPGPPPDGYEYHQEAWKDHKDEEHNDKEYLFLPGPKSTSWRSGQGAGRGGGGKLYAPPSKLGPTGVSSGASEAPPSDPSATSSIVADSGSDSGFSHLSEGGASPKSSNSGQAVSPVVESTPSASTAASSPATTITPASSVLAAKDSLASTTSSSTTANPPATTTTPTSSVLPAKDSPSSTAAAPSPSGAYPFTALVAFGDNLSDNGNGSFAHNVAAINATDVQPGNAIYGARTWTDGPVAVSYLSDLLHVPLTQNFAFGHAWGGSHMGATIDDTMGQSNFSASLADGPWFHDNEFSVPCWGAPSAKVQIDTYLSRGASVNKAALHFLWIGANDMDASYLGTLGVADAVKNAQFAADIAAKIPALVTTLLTAGAPYVLVANLYPKHLVPLWPNFLGVTTPAQWDALGAVIGSANAALEAALKALPDANRVVYYDAFTFMSDLYANPGDAFPNIKDTNGWPSFCDGDAEETAYVSSINGTEVDGVEIRDNWDYCVTLKHQDEWFWMQYLDPTSHVHRLAAADMERVVRGFAFPSL